MKRIKLRLYKHRFNDNWKIIVAAKDIDTNKLITSGISVFFLSPDKRYYTKCLKVIELDQNKAEEYFGHYLDSGSFEISNDFKKYILLK